MLKKIFGSAITFLFKKSPVLKMIISFVIALALFTIGYYSEIDVFWYVGLVFLGYTGIMFLIGMAYAWIINPLRDRRKIKKQKDESKEG